jgi:rubrerythrin
MYFMETTFESAIRGLREVGASAESHELVELLARHGKEEGVLLERYEHFAHDASTADVRYLVQLILDDERRHHRLLVEMATAVAWGWSKWSPDPAMPSLETPPDGTSQKALIDETKELLEFEKRDRVELRRLRKSLRPYADTTMWTLVLDVMLLDTKKHIRILEFIDEHAPKS